MRFIDTHAHLYDTAFDQDRAEVISRAQESGVTKILLPDVDSTTRAAMLSMSEEFKGICYPMVGVHPTSINEFAESWQDEIDLVHNELRNNAARYVAIGEIGMDLYWSQEFESQQRLAFAAQLDLALEYSLPVAIHVRDAWDATIEILSSYKDRGLRGVIHAFSGDLTTYNTIREVGDFLFAIGGVVTFKKAAIAKVVAEMSLDDLILETDAPYLTPTPHRGKRNESSYVPHIAEFIANLKGVTTEEVARITTSNAERMFNDTVAR